MHADCLLCWPFWCFVQCEGAIPALSTIEMPMVCLLATMERRGICLSKRVLGLQKPAMLRKLLQLEARAAAAVGGERFNLAAPGEVGKVRGCGVDGGGGGGHAGRRHMPAGRRVGMQLIAWLGV